MNSEKTQNDPIDRPGDPNDSKAPIESPRPTGFRIAIIVGEDQIERFSKNAAIAGPLSIDTTQSIKIVLTLPTPPLEIVDAMAIATVARAWAPGGPILDRSGPITDDRYVGAYFEALKEVICSSGLAELGVTIDEGWRHFLNWWTVFDCAMRSAASSSLRLLTIGKAIDYLKFAGVLPHVPEHGQVRRLAAAARRQSRHTIDWRNIQDADVMAKVVELDRGDTMIVGADGLFSLNYRLLADAFRDRRQKELSLVQPSEDGDFDIAEDDTTEEALVVDAIRRLRKEMDARGPAFAAAATYLTSHVTDRATRESVASQFGVSVARLRGQERNAADYLESLFGRTS